MAKSKKQIERPETDEERKIRERINAEQRRLRQIQSKADDEHRKQQNHIKIVAGAILMHRYPAEALAEMSEKDAKRAKEVYPDVFAPAVKQECQQKMEEATRAILSDDSKKKIRFVVDGAHSLERDKLEGHKNRLNEILNETDNAHRIASEAVETASHDESISGAIYSTMLTNLESLEADSKFVQDSLNKLEKA